MSGFWGGYILLAMAMAMAMAMAVGDGYWRWLLAMAVGDGCWRWLFGLLSLLSLFNPSTCHRRAQPLHPFHQPGTAQKYYDARFLIKIISLSLPTETNT